VPRSAAEILVICMIAEGIDASRRLWLCCLLVGWYGSMRFDFVMNVCVVDEVRNCRQSVPTWVPLVELPRRTSVNRNCLDRALTKAKLKAYFAWGSINSSRRCGSNLPVILAHLEALITAHSSDIKCEIIPTS
jgi:hypothetical protein